MAQGLGHVFFLLGHVVEICAVATTIFGSLIVASNERHTKEQLWEHGGGHNRTATVLRVSGRPLLRKMHVCLLGPNEQSLRSYEARLLTIPTASQGTPGVLASV